MAVRANNGQFAEPDAVFCLQFGERNSVMALCKPLSKRPIDVRKIKIANFAEKFPLVCKSPHFFAEDGSPIAFRD